jgi:hypothetical protein
MATVKTLSTSYTINTPEVIINGNLAVLGTQTNIQSVDLAIEDNTIALNVGETGNGVTAGSAGIVIDRGNLANVELRWEESFEKWQITNDGTNYGNILITGEPIRISDDATPTLGGNLNTNQYTIYSNIGNVNFDGNIQLNNTSVIPSLVSGATVVYAATPGAGTAGVYVVNGAAANQELITKTRAVGLSILL